MPSHPWVESKYFCILVYWEGKYYYVCTQKKGSCFFCLKICHVIHSLATVICVWSHWSLSCTSGTPVEKPLQLDIHENILQYTQHRFTTTTMAEAQPLSLPFEYVGSPFAAKVRFSFGPCCGWCYWPQALVGGQCCTKTMVYFTFD
jgi:hypothetical protein